MKTALDWKEECQYISDVTDKRGRVPEMNNDTATFVRYCEMQHAAATRDGFHDSATYIGECLDDLRETVASGPAWADGATLGGGHRSAVFRKG